MNMFTKSLLATAAMTALSANAAAISVNVSSDPNAEADFLAGLGSVSATENFDGLGTGQVIGTNDHDSYEGRSSSLSTDVGTFDLTEAGQNGANVHNDELMLESRTTGEHGRQHTLEDDDLWLDSNDAKEVTWTLNGPLTGDFNAFGFYLHDASDVGGNLTLSFEDGTTGDIAMNTVSGQNNGNVKYVTVFSDQNLLNGQFTFSNSVGYDGWGIDNATVGSSSTLPEPGTLVLMGLGLLGLGVARRRMTQKI